MPKQTVERVFSRRAFIFFLFVAPAAVLTLVVIILATQYKQLQSVVSANEAVPAFAWDYPSHVRLDSVLASIDAFSSGAGSDTLRFTARDLNLLAAASPTTRAQGIHFRITATDSLLIVETTQSIENQHRRLSWIFQKVIPREFQYLNARLEGLPQWKDRRLDFIPEAGYLNGGKVPRAALLKRSGMSARDFVSDSAAPAYQAFLGALDTTFYADGRVVMVRGNPADSAAAPAVLP